MCLRASRRDHGKRPEFCSWIESTMMNVHRQGPQRRRRRAESGGILRVRGGRNMRDANRAGRLSLGLLRLHLRLRLRLRCRTACRSRHRIVTLFNAWLRSSSALLCGSRSRSRRSRRRRAGRGCNSSIQVWCRIRGNPRSKRVTGGRTTGDVDIRRDPALDEPQNESLFPEF